MLINATYFTKITNNITKSVTKTTNITSYLLINSYIYTAHLVQQIYNYQQIIKYFHNVLIVHHSLLLCPIWTKWRQACSPHHHQKYGFHSMASVHPMMMCNRFKCIQSAQHKALSAALCPDWPAMLG